MIDTSLSGFINDSGSLSLCSHKSKLKGCRQDSQREAHPSQQSAHGMIAQLPGIPYNPYSKAPKATTGGKDIKGEQFADQK